MDKFDRDMLEMARMDAEFQYKNPNDYFSLEELEEIREVIAHASHTNPDVFHVIRQKIVKTIKESQKPEGEPKVPIINYYTYNCLALRSGKEKHSSKIALALDELYILDENLSDFATCRTSYKRYKEWQNIRIKIINEIVQYN